MTDMPMARYAEELEAEIARLRAQQEKTEARNFHLEYINAELLAALRRVEPGDVGYRAARAAIEKAESNGTRA